MCGQRGAMAADAYKLQKKRGQSSNAGEDEWVSQKKG
jgi:hypothetical protein